jgi:hypothetical protein
VLLSRCVLSRSSISRLRVRFSAHRVCPLPSPCAITVTSTAQIVLAAMHADSGRRQGQRTSARTTPMRVLHATDSCLQLHAA